jgi:hypothetical protein
MGTQLADQAANRGQISPRAQTAHGPTDVGKYQKVASNVSMSTYVQSLGSSEDVIGPSEKSSSGTEGDSPEWHCRS